MEVAGQDQDEGEFHKFRGLKGHRSQGQPARGAGDRLSRHHDADEQEDAQNVEGKGQLLQMAVVIQEGETHDPEPHQEPIGLFHIDGGGPLRGVVEPGAVQVDNADADDGENQRQQKPVKVLH